jgi:hypothetical protein
MGETSPEFNPLWTQPFQTNPFEQTLSSKKKVLKKIQQSREPLRTFTQQNFLEENSEEKPVAEAEPNIFFHFFTRNKFIQNFASKKQFHKQITLDQTFGVKYHSQLQKIFMAQFRAKRFSFRRKYIKFFLKKICQSKKNVKYNKFHFINFIAVFYRSSATNFLFRKQKSYSRNCKSKDPRSLLSLSKWASPHLSFFNGCVQRTIFFKKKINFFKFKAKKWRRRELFYFQKKWQWNPSAKVWQFSDEQPLLTFPERTSHAVPRVNYGRFKQRFFSMQKFICRWFKKKNISKLFWSDFASLIRLNQRKIFFGQTTPKKKKIFASEYAHFFNSSKVIHVNPRNLCEFNPLFVRVKSNQISKQVHKKINNKSFFEAHFAMQIKHFFSNFKGNTEQKIDFFHWRAMAQLYHFIQQKKATSFTFTSVKAKDVAFSLFQTIGKEQFSKANFSIIYDQKKQILEKKKKFKKLFFSKIIPSFLHTTHNFYSFKKKERILQKKLKKYCAVVSDRAAKKRQAFIERNLTIQANIQEETERKTPEIIESQQNQEKMNELNESFDETINLFKELRFKKFNKVFSKIFAGELSQRSTPKITDACFANFAAYQGINFLLFFASVFASSHFFYFWKKKSVAVSMHSFAGLRSEFACFKGQWKFPSRDTIEYHNLESIEKKSQKAASPGTERDSFFHRNKNETFTLFFTHLPKYNLSPRECYHKIPFQPFFNWEIFFKQSFLCYFRSILAWYYISVIITPRRNNLWVTVIPLVARSPKIMTYRRIFHHTAGILVQQKGKLRRSPETKKNLYSAAAFKLLRFSKKRSHYKFLIFKLPHFFQCLGKAKNYESVKQIVQRTFFPFISPQLRERLPLAEVFAPKTRPSFWGARLRGQPRRSRKHKPQIKKVSYLFFYITFLKKANYTSFMGKCNTFLAKKTIFLWYFAFLFLIFPFFFQKNLLFNYHGYSASASC